MAPVLSGAMPSLVSRVLGPLLRPSQVRPFTFPLWLCFSQTTVFSYSFTPQRFPPWNAEYFCFAGPGRLVHPGINFLDGMPDGVQNWKEGFSNALFLAPVITPHQSGLE